jgi:uncharacterized protein
MVNGGNARIVKILSCYQLCTINKVATSSGYVRKALPGDLDLLFTWVRAFNVDVKNSFEESDATLYKRLTSEIKLECLFIWEKEEPVSMLRVSGMTPTGIRISYVYTPAESRGKGYASSLVTHVSKLQLNSGRKFCFLFADASNQSSNRIYQRIGYRMVCNFHEYAILIE